MNISIPQGGQTAAKPPEVVAAAAQTKAQLARSTAAAVAAEPVHRVKAPDPSKMREELSQAIERLNEMMRKQGRDLSFSMDDRLNRTIIQVKSASTGELVRQIPDEAVLKVAHSIEDLKGLLLNEKS